MSIVVKLKPGESTDQLIKRFQTKSKEFREEISKQNFFVSETEKKQLAEKKKWAKIKKLESMRDKGII